MFDPSIESDDELCPKCGHETYTRDCGECEDGYSGHDCGEDACCCLEPEMDVECDKCLGAGYMHWCRRCAWDLNENRFLNGVDERTPDQLREDGHV